MNDCIMFTHSSAEYPRHPQANHLNQTRSSGAAPWAVLGPVAALCEFRSLILFGGCQNWPKIKFDHSFKQNIRILCALIPHEYKTRVRYNCYSFYIYFNVELIKDIFM